MPIRLIGQHAYVVDPVGTRLEPDYFDILVAELVGQRLIIRYHTWRRRGVTEDIRVNPGHVRQNVLLDLVLVTVLCKDVVN